MKWRIEHRSSSDVFLWGANYIKFKWFYEKVWKYLKENIEKWIVICNFGHAEKDLERPFLKFSSAILTVEDQTVDLFLKDDRWF